MRSPAVTLAIICACLCAARLPAENWSSFRGPGGSGVVPDTPLPTEWIADTQIRWKVRLPGTGWSQPVAWGD